MIDEEALGSIERLHRLKEEGVITEAEFDASKQKILFGQRQRSTATPSALREPYTGVLPAMDDHIAWMTLPLRRYADFEGRSSRKEFWMYAILHTGITVVAALLAMTLGTGPYGEWNGFGNLVAVLWVLALLGLLVPTLAVQVRRMHDIDRSGWYVALNLVPYIGALAVLVAMLVEGTRGENQYGPDPWAG